MKELLTTGLILGISSLVFSVEMKEKIRDEQSYYCDHCGKKARLQVHHKIPQRLGGADIRENGVGLCESCHEKWDELSLEGVIYPGIPITEAPRELYKSDAYHEKVLYRYGKAKV